MKIKKPIYGLMVISLFAGLLSGCSFGQPKVTEDPMAIYTMAAATVGAQLTGTAAMLPTSTETPQPTETMEPTATQTEALPSPTLPVISVTAGTGAPTLAVSATKGAAIATSTSVVQKSGDFAAYGSQSPKDGSIFSTDEEFVLMISMVNNGTTTWNKEYKMVFQSGTQVANAGQTACSKEATKPMESCDFYMAATAPINTGKYISRFWLVNAQGVKIPGGEVYFSFEVQ